MAKTAKAFGAFLLLIPALLLCACSMVSQQAPASVELERAVVVYVVDGDTLCVQRDSIEGPEKVRLIGIDCEESKAGPEYLSATGKQNTQAGIDAAEFTESLVPKGSEVWLQFDAELEDDYGRLLAYVWLEEPSDAWDEAEVSSKMLNAILLREGHADTMAIEPNTAYAEMFEQIRG